MLIKTLSHKWGKLNLSTLLYKVGLLTLINTLNNNADKFNLPHLWDRILINTPGLKLNK